MLILRSFMHGDFAIIHALCPCMHEKHRRKPHVADGITDREIFENLPLKDTWDDANLYSVFHYLWTSSSTVIPESWLHVMMKFECEFRTAVVGDPDLVAADNQLARPSS